MLRGTGQWQGNRTPDNQAANKLVDAGGIWFEDVGSTPTASISQLAQKKRQGSSRFFLFGFNSSPNWQSRRSNLSLSRICMEVLT